MPLNRRTGPDSMYHWYKELIALRKNPEYKDVVVYGEFVPYKEEQTNLMAYYRKGTDRTLLVVANYQHDAQDVVLPGTYKKVLMNIWTHWILTEISFICQVIRQ